VVATLLEARRPTRYRVVLVAVMMVAVGLLLSWTTGPSSVAYDADQPATPATEALDAHTWATAGCFLPGAAIDQVPGLFDFRHACIHHGGCYEGRDRTGSPAVIDRLRCDELFRTDLNASCATVHGTSTNWRARDCESTAEAYYGVARSFGASYYTGSGDPA
jgi:Prokaryotic phospholipase A2